MNYIGTDLLEEGGEEEEEEFLNLSMTRQLPAGRAISNLGLCFVHSMWRCSCSFNARKFI